MNGHNEREVIEFGYWTAKFLFDVSGKIRENVGSEISAFRGYLAENGFAENTTFVLDNQATILMTAYILLVYPKELLEQFDYNTLPNDLQGIFTFTRPAPPQILDNENFIRRIRNTIAHANVELELGENASFRLWNIPPNQNFNNRNLDATISKQNFVGFLGRLGGIYVNYLRNHPAEA